MIRHSLPMNVERHVQLFTDATSCHDDDDRIETALP